MAFCLGLSLSKTPRGIAGGGSGSLYGPELTTNGEFVTDSVWTKGADWTISGGAARKAPGTFNTAISEPIVLMAGMTYRVQYNASGLSGGPIRAQFTGGTPVNGALNSSPGVFTENLVAATGNITVEIFGATAANAVIKYISVRLVL